MYWLLFMLSVSYWYCLPVVSTSIFGYTEFRGYDFLLLAIGLNLCLKHSAKMAHFFQADTSGRWLLRFCFWATIMTLVTVFLCGLDRNFTHIGVVSMSLFHLWGFSLAYAAFHIFVQRRQQCLQFLDGFLLVGLVEATIICLQSVHLLPDFWNERYDIYGNMVFSGTLGKNRTLPGHMMVLILPVALSYAHNRRIVGNARLVLALIAAAFAVTALMASGSRTAWLVGLVFAVATVLRGKKPLQTLLFGAIIAAALSFLMPKELSGSIHDMYDYKVTGHLATVKSNDAVDKFQSIDAGRLELWVGGILTLAHKPYVIPFGIGFCNYYKATHAGGGSAHNIYITLIAELGVVGLYLYVKWLLALWQQNSRLISSKAGMSATERQLFKPTGMSPLLLALSVSLFGGEILYVFRPCFAFLGSFLFLCAILHHRALVYGSKPRLSRRIGIFSPKGSFALPSGVSEIGKRGSSGYFVGPESQLLNKSHKPITVHRRRHSVKPR